MFVINGGERIYEKDVPAAVRGFLMVEEDLLLAPWGSGRSGKAGPLQRMFRRVSGIETYCNAWGLVEMKTRLSAFPNGQKDGAYFFSEGLQGWLRRFDNRQKVFPQWVWCWEEKRLLSLASEELSIRGDTEQKHKLFRLPGTLQVKISTEDIMWGVPNDATGCALARAVSRQVGHAVWVDGSGVRCGDNHAGHSCFGGYHLGEQLREWTGRYDNGLQVFPIIAGVDQRLRRLEIIHEF